MMTIKDKLIKTAQENGLWEKEAIAIFDIMVQQDNAGPAVMVNHWNDRVDDYPPMMVNVLWLTFKGVSADWLAKNKPMHWARGMFDAEYAPKEKKR